MMIRVFFMTSCSNSGTVNAITKEGVRTMAVSSRGYLPSADLTPKNSPIWIISCISWPVSISFDFKLTFPDLRIYTRSLVSPLK